MRFFPRLDFRRGAQLSILATLVTGVSAAQMQQHDLARVQVGTNPGAPISPTFMGLSHEWGDAQRSYMGDSLTGTNFIYRQLLTNLTAYGSGPMILRIGGNSTDATGVPNATRALAFAEVYKAVGAHFILGVNLGAGDTQLAVTQTKAYLSQMPPGSVDWIEVGNEPDLLYKQGKRSASYSVPDYLADLDKWRASVEPILPRGTRIAGGAWASPALVNNMGSYASRERGTLFSQHYYMTAPFAHPPTDVLLKPKASTAGAQMVANAVKAAKASGIPFRIDEFNSVDDEGIPGISDAFGSALWVIDTMFEYANAGVDGVNVETSTGNSVGPFYFSSTQSGGKKVYSLTSIAPEYYGMLLFQKATGNHSRFLPATVNSQANVKAWATTDASSTPRLVLLNKDETQSGTVMVAMQGYTSASVERLKAPSFQAKTGVTLAGQTFDGSPDGKIQGKRTVESFKSSNGTFSIPLAATSGALVTFSK